jgi:hypothetical protein
MAEGGRETVQNATELIPKEQCVYIYNNHHRQRSPLFVVEFEIDGNASRHLNLLARLLLRHCARSCCRRWCRGGDRVLDIFGGGPFIDRLKK